MPSPKLERYAPNKLRELFKREYKARLPMDVGENLTGYRYYIAGNSIVLDPATDTENAGMQTVAEAIKNLKHLPEEHKQKSIIIPVSEQQKVFGLFKRNHWVTLHYNPATNVATLIDPRPWYASFFYPRMNLFSMLRQGIRAIYDEEQANKLKYSTHYQSMQYDDTYCGAWAAQNIRDLTSGRPIEHQRKAPTITKRSLVVEANEAIANQPDPTQESAQQIKSLLASTNTISNSKRVSIGAKSKKKETTIEDDEAQDKSEIDEFNLIGEESAENEDSENDAQSKHQAPFRVTRF